MSTSAAQQTLSDTAENAVQSEPQNLTDGFHLVIDALKLNGIETIYGVPGIPMASSASTAGNSG